MKLVTDTRLCGLACFRGYAQGCMPENAFYLFRRMIFEGMFPNHYAFGSILRACKDLGDYGHKLGILQDSVAIACCVFDEIGVSNSVS
ncbi:hypothetical protein RJ641_015119 [Dillenia turbinata]|uniref:Pentatricopeptide repeat-containing protein n=1 Tax=Dillenia turbinata TaxID=194707 RepID=A0AAN8Z0S4_9MAGN